MVDVVSTVGVGVVAKFEMVVVVVVDDISSTEGE